MGSCQNKKDIKTPALASKISPKDLKEKLSEITEALLADFENSIKEKMDASDPRSLQDLNVIINKSKQKVLDKYEGLTKNYTLKSSQKSQVKFFKLYLISKCESKEGFYRNQNDLDSCNYIFDLMFLLLSEIENQELTDAQSIQSFSKLAKGSCMIKGLDIYYNMIAVPLSERRKFLQNIEELEKKTLS